jgi:YidC/Oxa1 family membrane protein insertase
VFDFIAVPMNHLVLFMSGLAGVPLAIVLATISVRLLLVPAGIAQHRADLKRTALFARIAELQKRLANSPKRLEQEMGELYRAEGGGLARGCLPLLLQMPFFAAMYQLFVSPTVGGQANSLLQQTLFGAPLGGHLSGASGTQLLVFAGLLVLLAAISYASSRLLRITPSKQAATAPVTPGAPGVQGLLKVMPYATTVFALFLPLAATLYLVTTTAWTVAQTFALRQWG